MSYLFPVLGESSGSRPPDSLPLVLISCIDSAPELMADVNVFMVRGSTGGDTMIEPCCALDSVDLIKSSAPT